MRILFLAPDVSLEEQDGQAAHVIGISRALQDLGHDLLVLVGAAKVQTLAASDIPIRVIRNRGNGSREDAWQSAISFRPDVVYERRATPKLGLRLSRRLRVGYFLEINGIVDFERGFGRRQWLSGMRWRRNGILRRCEHFVVPSNGLAVRLSSIHGIPLDRFSIIPNGVDLSAFREIDKIESRKVLGWPLDRPILVFAGKLVGWQGLFTLLDAISLSEFRSRVWVALVGDGPLASEIANQIRERGLEETVKLTGPRPHSEVPLILSAGDLCIAPFTSERNSKIEISPLKLFEYMASGRAVVASDVPGVKGILRDAGLTVPPDSATELARAIDVLLRDPGRMQEMGHKGVQYSQRSSWKERGEILAQLLLKSASVQGREDRFGVIRHS